VRGAAWALLVGLGIGIGLVAACDDISEFDEPMILVGAERILHGEIPLKDFYAHYPPAQYYVVAVLLKVFGHSAMAMRVYCITVRALIALALYVMARRLVPRPVALAAWLAGVIWLSFCGFYGYTTFPALLFALIALSLLARGVLRQQSGERATPLSMLTAGGSLGAAALFRHDLAAYGLCAGMPCALAIAWHGLATPGPPSQRGLAGALRPLGCFLAGMVVVFGIPAAALLAVVPLHDVIFELFTYPATTYAQMRGLPYPALFPAALTSKALTDPGQLADALANVPFYTAPAFVVLGLAFWVARLRAGGRRALLDPGNLGFLSLVLFAMLAFNLARVRADRIHLVATVVMSYTVAAVVVHAAWVARRVWRWPAAGALIFVSIASLVVPLYVGYVFLRLDLRVLASGTSHDPATNCCGAPAEWETVAEYIRSVVPPGERIFVGCGRHDKVFMNQPVFYWLSDRLPGTKYHVLDPGIATRLDVQHEIVEGLVRHHVNYVILSTVYDNGGEPNQSSVSSGVTYLDEYLKAHYRLDRTFGPYLVGVERNPAFAARSKSFAFTQRIIPYRPFPADTASAAVTPIPCFASF